MQLNIRLTIDEKSLGFGRATKDDLPAASKSSQTDTITCFESFLIIAVEQGQRVQVAQEAALKTLNEKADVMSQQLIVIEKSMAPMETK